MCCKTEDSDKEFHCITRRVVFGNALFFIAVMI